MAAAAALTRYIASMLYGLAPLDFTTYTAVSIVFVAVAIVACAIPAHRATRVDPVVALRAE